MIDPKTLDFFRFFFRSYRKRSVVAIILLGMAGVMEGVGVVAMIPVLGAFDGAGNAETGVGSYVSTALAFVGLKPTLGVLLSLIVLLILCKAGLVWVAMRQVRSTMIWVLSRLRLRLLDALLRARWRFFAAERSGVWANAVTTETIQSGAAFREGCEIIAAVFPIGTYFFVAMLISWQTTLVAVFSGLLLLMALRRFIAHSRGAATEWAELTRRLAGTTVDIIQGLKPIKAMAREHLISPIFENSVGGLEAVHRRTAYAAENMRFFQEPALTLLMAGGIYFLVRVGDLPLAHVLVLAFVFYRILQHLNTLQMRYQVLVVGEASFWSLIERVEHAEREEERLHGGSIPGPLSQTLVFDRVSFSYEEGAPVIQDVSLEVPAGRFVAIVGPSGSGKTTMIDLVVGLHDPSAGRILIDGFNLADLNLRAWRAQIGYVPQEMLLLNDSVRHNVTLGDPELDDDAVEHALRLAGAWDFVSNSPKGINTEVGEKGVMLSGGQRQRIAIARALVTSPSILILDEVTTALDPDTEADICRTLKELSGDVTILSISHQRAMRDAADESYLMRAGTITRQTAQAEL